MADEPYSYIDLLTGAELVVADRVHSCVVAAAYGVPAWFLGQTPRSALLAPLSADGEGVMLAPNTAAIDELREAQVAWVREVLTDELG